MFDGISIIIPYYNDARNIPKCLASIGRAKDCLSVEDRHRIEIILIDDASPQPFSYPDLPEKFFICRLQKNSGVGRARNVGAMLAKYKYLMFIDSDVLLDKDHLAVVFDILSQKAVKILQGATSHLPANESPNLFHYYMAAYWHYIQIKYRRYFLSTFCMVINRAHFNRIGGFPECFSDSGGEEFAMAARNHELDQNAIFFDARLIFYHYYPGLIDRLQKVFVRGSRVKISSMPTLFKIETGARGLLSVLMTLTLFLVLFNPPVAVTAYFLSGSMLFMADWKLSSFFINKHSWRLALASILFRQIEYSTVFWGILTGRIKNTYENQ